MSDPIPSSSTGTLSDLLLRWRELRERGQEPSPEQLCRDRPELLSEARERIEAVKSMEKMLFPGGKKTVPIQGEAHAPIPIPQAIPGYEVLGELGRGGMGVVYKARQKSLNRLVALKMILAGSHAGPQQLARFKAEAEALARLHHENFVKVHEAGEHEGLLYLSLEYVEGGSLDRHLKGSPLPPCDAARLVESLARAVHVAHCAGIVHRDLKPANVLLASGVSNDPGTENRGVHTPRSPAGLAVPKITDFGLAKMLDSEGQTHSGAVLGTPAYMAPEQAEGRVKEVGPASDVYSLGAILYECLTGQPPFRGETAIETLLQVTSREPVAPSRIVPKLPRDLETICLKCLRKAPGKRYSSAEALADDLRRFLDGRPITARPVSLAERGLKWLRRRPERLVLFALLAIALPLLVIFLPQRFGQREEPREALAPRARTILYKYCFPCHGRDPDSLEGELAILDHAELIDRKVVVPGNLKESRLIERIEDSSMPPAEKEEYPRLSGDETEALKKWIRAGAPAFEGPHEEDLAPPAPPSPLAVTARDLLRKHCYECHHLKDAKNGIRVMNHDLLVEKRRLVIPGRPEESRLWKVLGTQEKKKRMPPLSRPRLKPEELEAIRDWIEAGAPPFPLSQ